MAKTRSSNTNNEPTANLLSAPPSLVTKLDLYADLEFRSKYDSRVVNHYFRAFIGLATGDECYERRSCCWLLLVVAVVVVVVDVVIPTK